MTLTEGDVVRVNIRPEHANYRENGSCGIVVGTDVGGYIVRDFNSNENVFWFTEHLIRVDVEDEDKIVSALGEGYHA